jgi:predicted dinucleotide-binding enzyme
MVFVAVPFSAWPDLARELAAALAGKVVIDAGNRYPATAVSHFIADMTLPTIVFVVIDDRS